ncbi:MAG: inosose isomerase [Spirochaetes bacterium]|nr:MAG: inosose isomerase [Spirochaetota bacterium]
MVEKSRLALNRIACPSLEMGEFFALAEKIGIRKVELRNDIRDGQVLDGLSAAAVVDLASARRLRIVTVNALQKFNLAAKRDVVLRDLDALLQVCASISCPALVLCPNNSPDDTRSTQRRFEEAVEALHCFGPAFKDAGVMGLVEPLGFGISSLASVLTAVKAIKSSGQGCYKVLADSFHHYLGPDSKADLVLASKEGWIGFVHISGVEDSIPKAEFLDAHRILPGPGDLMKSKETVEALVAAGYTGDVSFEPFSKAVQNMDAATLSQALKKSVDWLAI